MGELQPSFRRGAVRPVECLRGGWELIKDKYWLFLGITLVGTLLGSAVPLYLLWGPMVCGIHYCLFQAERRRPVKFEELFKGFDHFVPSLVATMLWYVPWVIIAILGYVAMFATMVVTIPGPGAGGAPAGLPPEFFVAMAVYFVVTLAAWVVAAFVSFFAYPLIVDRKLAGVQAMKTSLRAAGANLGGVLGLVVLQTVIMLAGYLACCVGLFFFLPVYFASIAVAYRQVFPEEYTAPLERTPEERDYDDQLELDDRPPEKGEGPPA